MGAVTTALLKVDHLPDATVLHLGSPFLVVAISAAGVTIFAIATAVIGGGDVPWLFVGFVWVSVFLYTQWRDLWTCSLTEPVLRHTPTLAGLSIGSRAYRVAPGSFFRVRDYRPFMTASWPPLMQLVLCIPEREVQIPEREVRIAVSRDEKFMSQVEHEMSVALSRWLRSNAVV